MHIQDIRLFLNRYNGWAPSNVSSFEVRAIVVGGRQVVSPPVLRNQQWIDLNRRGCSLSFYGDSTSLLWNYFEIQKHSVGHISRG